MSAMFVQVILLLIVSDCFGILNAEKLDHGKLPRQLLDLETFVNQKFQDVDRLLTEKDERIDQLQSILTNQKTEIARLKQGMASMEHRVTELETIVMLDTVQQEPESRQEARQSTLWMNGILDKFLSPINDTTPTRQNTRSPPTANKRTGESPFVQNSTSYSDSKDEIVADQSISQPKKIQPETETGDISSVKLTRPQQKRVTTRQLIAFHVALSRDTHFQKDNTVVYDNEKLDHGDGYNPADGIYTVHESGTYVFTWTSLCYVHQNFQTIIAVNGAYMGSSWTEAQDVNDSHQSTAVVVLNLNQGDHVFIRMGNAYGNGNILSRTSIGESTFSGWKLD